MRIFWKRLRNISSFSVPFPFFFLSSPWFKKDKNFRFKFTLKNIFPNGLQETVTAFSRHLDHKSLYIKYIEYTSVSGGSFSKEAGNGQNINKKIHIFCDACGVCVYKRIVLLCPDAFFAATREHGQPILFLSATCFGGHQD